MSKKYLSFQDFTLCEAIATGTLDKALSLISGYLKKNTSHNFSQVDDKFSGPDETVGTRMLSDDGISIQLNWSETKNESNELHSVDVMFGEGKKTLNLEKSLSLVKTLPILVNFINGSYDRKL